MKYDFQTVLVLAFPFVWAYTILKQKKSRRVPQPYDVFLCFYGLDTRSGFTSCLYDGLVDAGFRTFRDDRKLELGKQIDHELSFAIRNSRIAIPIISKQYAQRTWCLNELTEIMDCHNNHNTSVFPIFYKVNASDIADPTGDFKKALSKYKAKHSKKVPKWAEALTSVAWIRGWASETTANGLDGELVKSVVKRVSSELKTMWIEQLPLFPKLLSFHYIRSVHGYFSEKRGEVYLSFGDDTRLSFAASLYDGLVTAGIKVLKDDDPSLIGTHLEHGIINAIDSCKISISILSINYANHEWCLVELAQMVECNRRKGQKILPIFYNVKPSHVRKVSQNFKMQMHRHKERQEQNVYRQWEQALKKVGSSAGLELKNVTNGNEGLLVKEVVKKVLGWLTNSQEWDAQPLSDY